MLQEAAAQGPTILQNEQALASFTSPRTDCVEDRAMASPGEERDKAPGGESEGWPGSQPLY